jgi:hypothetical protein
MRADVEMYTYMLETCNADVAWIDSVVGAQKEVISGVIANQDEIHK